MIPVHCRVAHEPENGKYGDCLRACIASLMELKSEDVPHFYHDNPEPFEANRRLDEFLASKGFVAFWTFFDGNEPLENVFATMDHSNPEIHYLLFHTAETGEGHVVVCKGGAMDFNPAWYRSKIAGPSENGVWGIMVIALK